jgi:hypothetical protein
MTTPAAATTAVPPAADLADPLTTAASLLAAAALAQTAAAAPVAVTVSGGEISVQIPAHAGDQRCRAAAVAAYAHALHTPVHHRRGGRHGWIEAHSAIAGHPVHVWTIADPDPER